MIREFPTTDPEYLISIEMHPENSSCGFEAQPLEIWFPSSDRTESVVMPELQMESKEEPSTSEESGNDEKRVQKAFENMWSELKG